MTAIVPIQVANALHALPVAQARVDTALFSSALRLLQAGEDTRLPQRAVDGMKASEIALPRHEGNTFMAAGLVPWARKTKGPRRFPKDKKGTGDKNG